MISDINHYSPLGCSDHVVLIFDFNCYTVMDSNPRMKFSCDRGDFPAKDRDMDIDWPSYFRDCSEDVNLQWSLFKSKLLQTQDLHIPHRLSKGQPK